MPSRTWTRRLAPDDTSVDIQVTLIGPLGRKRPVILTVDTGTPVTILNVDVATLRSVAPDQPMP